MTASKECLAGFGSTTSLWFHFMDGQMVGYSLEEPNRVETFPPDTWFDQHMLMLGTSKKSTQKSNDVLPYLTYTAGERAVRALRDYHVYELAIAFTSHYSWQLVNGAKILPALGELAKVYAGQCAVYLFRSEAERRAAEQKALLNNWNV
jgi:hypothetical protein